MPDHELNPWIDFKYGTHYASDFGLLRVSGGNRYNENLIPTLNDKTAEVPGGDGMYYFNSYYKQKQFNINFAYDHLTETQLRQVRSWLNGKEIQELKFDERDDRVYFAKVTGSPSFKYIPFDDYERHSNNIVGTLYYASPVSVLSQTTVDNWPSSNTVLFIEGSNKNGVNCSRFTQGAKSLGSYMIGSIGIGTDSRTIFYAYWSKSDYTLQNNDPRFPLVIKIKSIEEYNLLSQFFDLTSFYPVGNPELIYKGEGSVTFTCYDPFSYSDEISYESGIIDGDLPTNFIITTNEGINANTIITLKNGANGPTIGEIKVLQAIASNKNFTWNGKTGLISCDDGPIKFTGNSMVMIHPDQTPVLSGISDATFTYRKRYY